MAPNDQQIRATRRRTLILKFRRRGHTHAEIAKLIKDFIDEKELPKNWGPQYVSKDIGRILKQMKEEMKEELDTVRQLELDRLDALHRAIWDDALSGQVGKIDRILDIMQRRERYIPGLAVPTEIKADFNGKIESSPDGLARSLSALASTLNSQISSKTESGQSALESGEPKAMESGSEPSG